jgi:alpha-L-fucosidase
MGDGSLPPEHIERLEAIGDWMDRNNEAIVGTDPGLEPWQFYGPSTRRGNRVYLHVLAKPYESVSVRGVKVKHVGDVRPLSSTISLKVRKRISAADSLFNQDPIGELVIATPDSALDSMATIIAVDFQR